MEVLAALLGTIVEGVARVGPGPFAVGVITVGGFLALDRLTKSGVAKREREDNIALKVISDAAVERERHFEERDYDRKQEARERERLDKFETLIHELTLSLNNLKGVINDLDQRLTHVMKMYGEKNA